jgi:hypothetical protein
VIRGRLTSYAGDLVGNLLGSVDRPVNDIPSMLRGVGAAELELSVKAPDRGLLVSAIVVPGVVDRRSNTGEAPWLFGKETIDPRSDSPHSFLISGAGSLTAKHATQDGTWMALDLANSLSGLLLTRMGEPIPLDLAHLEPNPAIISDEALELEIQRAAESKSSVLGKMLLGESPVQALSGAVRENDHVACALVDRLVGETLDLVRTAARTLRPTKLLLSSPLLDPILELEETMAMGLARHIGMNRAAIMLVSPRQVLDDRFIGACRAALNLRLGEVVSSNGTLKVE